ncbi:MAG: tripartite tricarboxylate transporter substrate binding protein [Curvibacter sp.]
MQRWISTAAALLLACGAVCAQTNYPEKPIKLVVPYAPGGSADITARLISDALAKAVGGTIFIENKGGAGGNLGVDFVAKSAGDGYTIGLQTVSLAINPGLTARMPYDTLKDLAPIGMIASSQHVLVTGSNFSARSVADVIRLAKAKPGTLSYGSAGPGSTFHMSAELFKAVAGVSILHIPYRGGGPALIDTISGQVDMSFPVLAAAVPHIQSGKLRALGVTGSKRSPLLPEVPTIAEAGLSQYQFETWFMLFAPASTPRPVLDKLNAGLRQVLESAEVKERMAKDGFEPTPSSAAEARARLERELQMWAKLTKERGITAE